jgi:prepilin-type N-terminal cleavage/methylation domain-containing protein
MRCWRVTIHRRAFTLIELLVVLTIIGVLAGGMTALLVRQQAGTSPRLAAEDLATAFAFAAEQAQLRNITLRVAQSEDGQKFRVEQVAGLLPGDRIPEDAVSPVEGMAGRWHRFPGDTRIVAVLVDGRQVDPPPIAFVFGGGRAQFTGVVQLAGAGERWQVVVHEGTITVEPALATDTQSGVHPD